MGIMDQNLVSNNQRIVQKAQNLHQLDNKKHTEINKRLPMF